MSAAVHPVVRWSVLAPRRVLVLLVRAYQLLVSPLLGPVCRYAPSCSSYAVGALQTHGALRGSALAAGRVLRCHPWAAGGWDPVPVARSSARRSGR